MSNDKFYEADKTKYNYVLWVGAVDDYYTDLDRAVQHFWEWIDEGYEDVILEDLKTNTILKRG